MTKKPDMFYGASPGLFEKARMLRQNMTQHEKILWEELRANKLLGLRFKAQHPISAFVADFYCHKLKLVVEIDGDNHSSSDQSEYDHGRAYEMEQLGIATIRFSNNEVDRDLREIIFKLKCVCEKAMENSKLLSTPTLKGEGNAVLKAPVRGLGVASAKQNHEESTPTLKGEAGLNFETKKPPSWGWGQGT